MLTRTIDSIPHQFESRSDVCSRIALPADFSLKSWLSYTQPPRLFWQADEHVQKITDKLLTTIPSRSAASQLPDIADKLAALLRSDLVAHSTTYNMGIDEIDMMVLDFRDLLMSGIYAFIEQAVSGSTASIKLERSIYYVNIFLADTSYWSSDTYSITALDGQLWHGIVAFDHFGPFGARLTPSNEQSPIFMLDLSLTDPAGHALQQLAIVILERLFEINVES